MNNSANGTRRLTNTPDLPQNDQERHEIDKYMRGVTEQEKEQWLALRQQAKELQARLQSWAMESDLPAGAETRIQQAETKLRSALERHLDYKRRYTISVAGVTGAGKSTLINALTGLNLLATAGGGAVTGTVVTVRQVDANDLSPWVTINNDQSLFGQARIQYHTLDSLKPLVGEMCQKLGKFPVATNEREGNQLDVHQMLEWVRIWDKGEAISCPNCNHSPKKKEARFCWNCRQEVKPEPSVVKSQSGILPALEDLLTCAQHHLPQLRQKEWVEIILLDDAKKLNELHDAVSEHSARNKKQSTTRILPLIKKVECEVIPQEKADALLQVDLTDIPGSAATNALHKRLLHEYLNPLYVDAIMLVMDDVRPERATSELVPVIREALKTLSDPNDLRTAADRTFVVISKRDLNEDVHGAFQQNVERAIKSVADAILPHTYEDSEWQKAKLSRKIMARSGLIAQVMQAYPNEAAQWSADQPTPFLPPKLKNEPYFAVKDEATGRYPSRTAEEAVLQYSGIALLREKLRQFLSRSRWELDMGKAQALYREAYDSLDEWMREEWRQITKSAASDDPDHDLRLLNSDQIDRYLEQVQSAAQDFLQRFRQVRDEFARDGSSSHIPLKSQLITELSDELAKMVGHVKNEMAQYVTHEEFKESLSKVTITWDGKIIIEPSFAEQLNKLEMSVLHQFDHRAAQVAAAMKQALERHLSKEEVEKYLEEICTDHPNADKFNQEYRQIIQDTCARYQNACRGVILYEVMNHQVITNEIMGDKKLFSHEVKALTGTPMSPAPPMEASPNLLQLVTLYDTKHKTLVQPLPERMYKLFLYELTIADEQIEALAKQVERKLIQEVASNPSGNLVRRLRALDKNMSVRADWLTKWRRELIPLKPN